MGLSFINKRTHLRDSINISPKTVVKIEENKEVTKKHGKSKNKNDKKEETMNNMEMFEAAESALKTLEPEVKVVKKERGLIERTESSKIILTEDNRQVLND